MNLKNSALKIRIFILFLLAAFVFGGAFFSEISAQNTRRQKPRKTRAKTNRPVPPTAIPAVVPASAEVVSRDDDYNQQNQSFEQTEQTITQTQPAGEVSGESAESYINRLNQRLAQLESAPKKDPDEKQKRLRMNLEILNLAETRTETLRKQLFDVIDREGQIRTRLDQIAADIRPEMIERQVAFSGSLKPEELRDARRKSMEIEKRNLELRLTELQTQRTNLESNVQKSDAIVQKLRDKLESQIDAALSDDPQN